jgi:tRNA nucleotidyltransferase (CCA-adding enzyme)
MIFSRPASSDLSARLMQALTPVQGNLLRLVADEAARQRLPLYLVGGFVRDLLLGRLATDFDLVVEGDAIRLAHSLAQKHGGKVTAHTRFGTAQWFLPESLGVTRSSPLDLISARSETYKHPGALPTVRLGTLADDLCRRDFTVNTLALRLDGEHFGELRDDLGGLADLEKGLISVLHPRSFRDDPTRPYRAVRYEQRYGFQIAPETLALIPEASPLVENLSAERVRHEFDLILEEANAAEMLIRLNELGLLRPLQPLKLNGISVDRMENGFSRVSAMQSKSIPLPGEAGFLGWHFWLMDSSPAEIESIEKRMHFHANLFRSLLAASTLRTDAALLVRSRPSACVKRLDEFPLTAIYAVFLALPEGELRRKLYEYLETWRHIRPKTNGHTLKKLGLEPGPEFQNILSRLRDAWLDGQVKSEEEEQLLLDKLIIIR